MYGAIILPIILGYALLMGMFGVTKPNNEGHGFFRSFFQGLAIGIPVGIFEEFIFRYLIFYKLFIQICGLDVMHALIFSSLIFAYVHFDMWWFNSMCKALFGFDPHIGGMHKNSAHKVDIFVGLFLFAMICCKLFFGEYSNIVFHASAVTAVTMTANLLVRESEANAWLWDEGHCLVRVIFIQLILIAFYFYI